MFRRNNVFLNYINIVWVRKYSLYFKRPTRFACEYFNAQFRQCIIIHHHRIAYLIAITFANKFYKCVFDLCCKSTN